MARAVQTSSFPSKPLIAAACMIGAGASFALVNVCLQAATMQLGLPAASAAFWQYLVALLFALPWILRRGRAALVTRQPKLHALRILLAVGGVQAWVFGLAHVPIWQAIALIMTSPFFVILGARIFLKEQVGPLRWLATLLGFAGGMVILAPWSERFELAALLPVLAAALWGGASLVSRGLPPSGRSARGARSPSGLAASRGPRFGRSPRGWPSERASPRGAPLRGPCPSARP